MALTKIEKYRNDLEKLIKAIPKGYKLCYDMMACNVYVVNKKAKFIDNEINDNSAGYAGGGCPKGVPGFSNNTGRDKKNVIGEGIYIDMEAVQS